MSGGALGRTLWHDQASRAYPAAISGVLKSVKHAWRGPKLNQLDLGGCTGFALTNLLNCDPFAIPVAAVNGRPLSDWDAVGYYAIATTIDPYQHEWPITDTGSSGLAVCKGAKRSGVITSYSHAFGQLHTLGALVLNPVLIGIPWYEGMDTPSADGHVTLDGKLRGYHEVCLNEIDDELQEVSALQSWGEWGLDGTFKLTWDQLGTLLGQQGDCSVPKL